MNNVEIAGDMGSGFTSILSDEAIAFLVDLHRHFDATRRDLLSQRHTNQDEIDAGGSFSFLPETAVIRSGDWSVQPAPPHWGRYPAGVFDQV